MAFFFHSACAIDFISALLVFGKNLLMIFGGIFGGDFFLAFFSSPKANNGAFFLSPKSWGQGRFFFVVLCTTDFISVLLVYSKYLLIFFGAFSGVFRHFDKLNTSRLNTGFFSLIFVSRLRRTGFVFVVYY